ncbi:MAG: FIST C-terminal domain-containing protein [Actinomycetota bacterium]
MSEPKRRRRAARPSPFVLAHAGADHWGRAAKACLEGVAEAAGGSNIGFLYATEEFATDLSSILTFLRETTHIEHWVGGVAPGVCAGRDEYRDEGALAVMVGHLPEGAFRPFSCLDPGTFLSRNGEWLAQQGAGAVGLVHADPRNPAAPEMVAEVAAAVGWLAGGFVAGSGPPAQVADSVTSGGLSGVLLGSAIEVMAGLTQGCTPIGPSHRVTEAWEGVLMALDGRPALEMLKEEAGELIARDLRRAAGYIHVGLTVEGSDTNDYVVRNLLGVDPRQGWLAIGDRLELGQQLMFVRRDANAAQADLRRMLRSLKARLGGRRLRAGFYFSCVARGSHMFGEDGGELALIAAELGDFPLIGCYANGEISRDRLYGYTGVLALIPEPKA